MKEQWTFVLAVAIATMLLTSGCVGTNDYILAEMGLQTFDKPCVAKNGVNGDFGIDESINCCIEAATHLGFWYDASKSISSKFSFEARWKGSIVYYGVTIFRVGPRTLHFDYVAGCGGDVYGDGGNVKIWKLFLGEVHRARKNRERLSNSVGQSTVNNPVEKESDSTIPQVPDTSGLQNLSGTTWLGKDSEGEFLELRFKDHGIVYRRCPGVSSRSDTWRQQGNTVHIDINKGYAQYEGIIGDGKIEGKAWNIQGVKWTWMVAVKR